MTVIYDQFDKATAQVGAYAILKDGKFVGRVVFKYPRDGAGRLYCYLQAWGATMVRGFASGGGYDKRTAAFEDAARKLQKDSVPSDVQALDTVFAFLDVAAENSGERWDRRLETRGYVVACVID